MNAHEQDGCFDPIIRVSALVIFMVTVLFMLSACQSLTGLLTTRTTIRTTTTARSIAGGETTTVVETPYVSPEDQAHADAILDLFGR